MRSGTLLVGSSWRIGGTDASVCAMSASSSAGLRLGAGLGLLVGIGLGLTRPPVGPADAVGNGEGLETAQAATRVVATSATRMRVASLAARGRSGIGES
jgi:hypothetical protein